MSDDVRLQVFPIDVATARRIAAVDIKVTKTSFSLSVDDFTLTYPLASPYVRVLLGILSKASPSKDPKQFASSISGVSLVFVLRVPTPDGTVPLRVGITTLEYGPRFVYACAVVVDGYPVYFPRSYTLFDLSEVYKTILRISEVYRTVNDVISKQ
jgi:hypothetical protein